MNIPKALTIAGSDSGGGAGIQADLKTFAAFEVYGASVITAVTAQNTTGVAAIYAVSPELVSRQIEAVLTDIGADAIKTGMLANTQIIEAVASGLRRYRQVPLVVDPVMVAKSGDALLAPEAVCALREKLLPLAKVVTPNLSEAEVLVGRTLQSEEDSIWAVKKIQSLGTQIVILKGGHRAPLHREGSSPQLVDLFFDGREIRAIEAPLINTPHTHGTGCTFASAIAAGLAKGLDPFQASLEARHYLTGALRRAYAIGAGKSPVHHFHRWWTVA